MENSTIFLLLSQFNTSSCGLVLDTVCFIKKKITAYYENTVVIKKSS